MQKRERLEEVYDVLALRELLEIGSISTGTRVYREGGVNSSLAYLPIITALKDSGLVRKIPIEKSGSQDVREAYKITRKGKWAYNHLLNVFEELRE